MDPTSPLFIEYNDSGVFSCSFIPSGHFFPPAKAPSRLARRQSRPTPGKPALPPPRLPERRILWDSSYSVPQAARRGLQLPACNAPRRRATGPPSERHAGSCSLHHSPPPHTAQTPSPRCYRTTPREPPQNLPPTHPAPRTHRPAAAASSTLPPIPPQTAEPFAKPFSLPLRSPHGACALLVPAGCDRRAGRGDGALRMRPDTPGACALLRGC